MKNEKIVKLIGTLRIIKLLYILALPIAALFTLTGPVLIVTSDPGVKASNSLWSCASLFMIIVILSISMVAKKSKTITQETDPQQAQDLIKKATILLRVTSLGPLVFFMLSFLLKIFL